MCWGNVRKFRQRFGICIYFHLMLSPQLSKSNSFPDGQTREKISSIVRMPKDTKWCLLEWEKWDWKLMARQIWWCVCKIFRFIHFISADTAPKLQLIYNKPPTVLYMATQNTAFHVAFFFILFLFLLCAFKKTDEGQNDVEGKCWIAIFYFRSCE